MEKHNWNETCDLESEMTVGSAIFMIDMISLLPLNHFAVATSKLANTLGNQA